MICREDHFRTIPLREHLIKLLSDDPEFQAWLKKDDEQGDPRRANMFDGETGPVSSEGPPRPSAGIIKLATDDYEVIKEFDSRPPGPNVDWLMDC
jgi:hypothetical protein